MPKFIINHPKERREVRSEKELDPVRNLLSWRAPSRPYRKKDRSYYTTIAIIVTLLILIALLAHEFLLIGALLALSFVTYVLGFTPPDDVDYKISTQGVTIGDHFYHWETLDSFYFTEKDGSQTLNIFTLYRFPGILMLVIEKEKEEQIKNMVARYLPFHEIAPKTFMDRWAERLQKHFPLENPHKS